MSNELALTVTIVGLISTIIAIVSFVLARKEKGEKNGEKNGEMLNDIKYIKQMQTDIMVGQKEISNKLDGTKERVTRLEEQVKIHDKEITRLKEKK